MLRNKRHLLSGMFLRSDNHDTITFVILVKCQYAQPMFNFKSQCKTPYYAIVC